MIGICDFSRSWQEGFADSGARLDKPPNIIQNIWLTGLKTENTEDSKNSSELIFPP